MERNVPKLRFKGFNDEWENKKLGEFLTFYSTNSFSRDCLNYENGDAQNIHYGDIHMKFPTILDTEKYNIPYINSDINISKYSEESFCKDGDLVIADASEDYADIGKSIEVCNIGNKKILAGLHTILARDNKLVTVNGFKGYMMQSESVRKQVKVLAAGAKVLGISKSNLEKVNVKLPSLQEQERISNFLTKVDKIIEKQDEKVKNLEKYKKGMMQKIFSQEIRFKDENGEEYPAWEEKRLKEITIVLDNMRKPLSANERQEIKGDIPYYGANGIVDYIDDYIFDERLILLAEDGGNFDEFASKPIAQIIDGKTWVNNHAHVLRTINSYVDYIFYTLVHKDIRKYINGTSRAKLNQADMLEIVIPFPCLEEQIKIANFLDKIYLLIVKESIKLEELRQWKKGLLQQMFV